MLDPIQLEYPLLVLGSRTRGPYYPRSRGCTKLQQFSPWQIQVNRKGSLSITTFISYSTELEVPEVGDDVASLYVERFNVECFNAEHFKASLTHSKFSMAPVKRKGLGESEVTRPEKKHKASAPVSKLSVLRNEEPAFPRGGASILTPLEHKQIHIQAKGDVLFEQSTGKKSARNEFEGEENEEEQPEHGDGAPLKAKRKKGFKKRKFVEVTEEVGVRIEGLSYKVGSVKEHKAFADIVISASYQDPSFSVKSLRSIAMMSH